MDPQDQTPTSKASSPSSDQKDTSDKDSVPFLTDPVMPEEPSSSSQPPISNQKDTSQPESFPQPPPQSTFDQKSNQQKDTPPTPSSSSETKSTLDTDYSDSQPPSPPDKPPTDQSSSRAPAQPPSSSSLKPVLLIALILIVLAAIGGGAYFYLQNQTLKQQLSTIQSQIQAPTPSPTPTPTSSPVASPDSYPTVETTSPPTPTITDQNLTAFSPLSAVIDLARQNHSQAQLLMITADNILSSPTYKYWFRKQPDLKDYFFVRLSAGQSPEYISQATVTPDNNIPNLLTYWQDDNLGQSDRQLLSSAQQQINTQTDQDPTAIAVKFIRARPSNPNIQPEVNLWQFTFRFSNRGHLIVQYNAQNQELVYKNF